MAKRKSSKTTAQSDPTVSEDVQKDSVESDIFENSDQGPESDSVSSRAEYPDVAGDLPKSDDTPEAREGDDTLIAQDALDTVVMQGADETVTAEDVSDTVAAQDGDNSVTPLDADDSIAAEEAERRVTAEPADETAAVQEDDIPRDQDDIEAKADESTLESSEPEPETPETLPERVVQPTPEPKPRTVMPMILGGFIAALLGFVAARSDILDPILPASMRAQAPVAAPPSPAFDDSELTSQLAALSTRIGDLEATVAALPEPQSGSPSEPAPEVDLSAIEAEIAALTDQVKDIANQPATEAPVPTEALDAALADLREKASEQQAEIDKLLADQQSTIKDAEMAAKATLARTAMTGIQAAIDAGAPFDLALAELEQTDLVDVPQELKDIAVDGVASLANLQETLPDAAREALYAARDAETGSGLGGFIQLQLGVRAVEPREGSDPDAVLSRVEAATRAGDLETALTEARALPAPAQDAMSSWIDKAQSRHNAVTAANALAERLSAL
ncbi:hypothetical protein [Tateyamaria pelophila]|uniref:hypothetical protein n=1 Tax=Tateyamaria pelophila TaxID=328415 RepID=UPI001CBD0062|nr:hypothetical protein [Tateyamaria pelophila]